MGWMRKQEKGVTLILFACLLPFFFLCAGFAFDLGNAFAHKSKLQNAADAAALAGAARYAESQDWENGRDTVDSHANADEAAAYYVGLNAPADVWVEEGPEGDYRAQAASSGKSYYRVYLEEEISTTFTRIAGIGPTLKVAVDAVAEIPSSAASEPFYFKNLVTVGNTFWGSFDENGNGNDSYSYWHSKGIDRGDKAQLYNVKITGATFDGTFMTLNDTTYQQCTDPNFWGPDSNDYAINGYYKYFKYAAKEQHLTRYEAEEKNLYQELQKGDPDEYAAEYEKVNTSIANLFASGGSSVVRMPEGGSVTVPSGKAYYYEVPGGTTQNLAIHLVNPSVGDDDNPVVVYIPNNFDDIYIYLDEDITNPIVVMYSGHQKWWTGETNITYESRGHDFRGVIYAPTSRISPFNGAQKKFEGSLIAKDLELNNNIGPFTYVPIGVPGVNGTGGSGTEPRTGGRLRLVSDSGLQW